MFSFKDSQKYVIRGSKIKFFQFSKDNNTLYIKANFMPYKNLFPKFFIDLVNKLNSLAIKKYSIL